MSSTHFVLAALAVMAAIAVWLSKSRSTGHKEQVFRRTDSLDQTEVTKEEHKLERQLRESSQIQNEQENKLQLEVDSNSIQRPETDKQNAVASTNSPIGEDIATSHLTKVVSPPEPQGPIATESSTENGKRPHQEVFAVESEPNTQCRPVAEPSIVRVLSDSGPSTSSDKPAPEIAVGTTDPSSSVERPLPQAQLLEQTTPIQNAIAAVLDTETPKPRERRGTPQTDPEARLRPGDYRPPRVRQLSPEKLQRKKGREKQSTRGNRPFPFELRLQANPKRNGICSFRLVAKKPNLFPGELEVKRGNKSILLVEAGDDWYEAQIDPKELAGWLTDGVILHQQGDDGQRNEWQLSRREVFVLAGQPGFAGLVSTTRLEIGRRHLVLCKADIANSVESVLHEAGCGVVHPSAEEQGAPAEWVFFWPVEPTRPVPEKSGDIFDILRPQPQIEIVLESGLWMRDSTWLAQYPPEIRIAGVLPAEEKVYIDGVPAQRGENGCYTVDGYDRIGPHQVVCGGKSATYSISSANEGWESWNTHRFHKGFICGASVTFTGNYSREPVTVPAVNRLLLGSHPGQVFVCGVVTGRQWVGFVPFTPIWALPIDPLHCDGRSNRILLVSDSASLPEKEILSGGAVVKRKAWCWSQSIYDCSLKRLAIEPSNEQTIELWRAYVVKAKSVKRRLKN